MHIGLRRQRDQHLYPLKISGEIIVGSEEGCSIVLEDGGVAAKHAIVRITQLGIEIDAVGDAPTLVNRYQITKHFLSPKDALQLGSAQFVVEVDADPDAQSPPSCRRCGVALEKTELAAGQCTTCTNKPASKQTPRPASGRIARPGSGIGPVPGSATPRPGSSTTPSPRPGSSRVNMGAPPEDIFAAVDSDQPTRRFRAAPKDAFTTDWMSDYSPVKILGEGSQGRVYKLKHRVTGEVVAGKRLWASSPATLARLQREIEAMRRLDHPNIVKLIEVKTSESATVLLMEYVDGPSLSAMVKKEKQIPKERALRMAAQVASALAYAASVEVTHRDVKPSNILVASGDVPKLTDFGLARLEDSHTKLTAEGQWIGTPHYMSPEQVNGSDTDGRTDVWALAITFFEAITGKLPFEAQNPPELFKKITRGEPNLEPLKAIVGPDITALFKRCLTKAIEDRPKPAEVAEAFAELAGG